MSRIIDDDFLYANMPQTEKAMLSNIPPEDELSHKFSRRFNRKMAALLKHEHRTPTMRMLVRQMKTAAVVFVIVLSMAFGTVMSVESYRIRFFEFVTTVWEELTSTIINSDDNADHDRLTPIESTYIPQGYKVIEQENSLYQNTIIYADGNEIYYAQEMTTQSEFIIDSENVDAETIEIENQALYLLQNKGTVQLYWHDEFYVYSLIGDIESVKLTMMAESILKK